MPLPNFIIIGAGRSGTTSLYHYLKQHPEIYMSPVKEPSFFAPEKEDGGLYIPEIGRSPRNIVSDMEDYQALFAGVKNEKAIGEASVAYLMRPRAAEKIKKHIPKAKLIAILRNPADRQYSWFLAKLSRGLETRSFSEMVEMEKESAVALGASHQGYLGKSFYYARLKHYFKLFSQSQIRVYLYQDLQDKPLALVQDIYRFLEVDDNFVPDMSIKYAKTGVPKDSLSGGLLRKRHVLRKFVLKHIPFVFPYISAFAIKLKNRHLVKPSLSSEIRKQLIEIYREDILKLQELIQRDLSKWLE